MPPVTFPAWKSFSTGKNPGKLGLFGHIQLEKGKLTVCNASTVKDNTEMWDHLSSNDKKVAVIGVPITYPPKKVRGIMVSGPFSVGHNFTYPKDLEPVLKNKYKYDPFPEEFLLQKDRDIGLLMKSVKSKFKFLYDVLLKDYDFICSVIFETDTAQHFLWGTKDLKELWKLIDKRLKPVVNLTDSDPDTILLMCSDHGFHKMKGAFYVNEWLRKRGYLKFRKKFTVLKLMSRFGITSNRLYALAKKLKLLGLARKIWSPESLRKIGKTMPTEKKMVTDQGIAAIADLERSKAYFIEGGVYIKDRSIVEELYEELKALKDDDGINFLDVGKKAEEYWGDHLDQAPDLLIWSERYSLRGHVSLGKTDFISTSPKKEKWVATHHKDGIFLAYGSKVRKGLRIDPHIYDIAPTVLALYGISPDPEMDGKVIGEIFEDIVKPD